MFEKAKSKDNMKVTVEGINHDGKILVEKIVYLPQTSVTKAKKAPLAHASKRRAA